MNIGMKDNKGYFDGYFYDEIPMQASGNVILKDNIMHGEIKSLTMNIHERYG